MRVLVSLLFLCNWLSSFAQQVIPSDNLLLGYQKFPTTITGHAFDSSGNQYFTGTFKGELTINDKVVTSGNGLEDIFWVKTNANGQLLSYKIFGSAGAEQSINDGLVTGENADMLFGFLISEQVTVGSIPVTPYSSSSPSSMTGCIVYADSSGAVKWVKRTTLSYFKLFYADNVFHVIGNTSPNSPAVKVENNTVFDSTGLPSVVHLMFDKAGKLLSSKIISPRKKNQSVGCFTIQNFSDKKLLIGISCFGDSAFFINNKPISLPSAVDGYSLLVKADTSYNDIKAKILSSLTVNGSLPITCSPNDSIYLIVSNQSSAPFSFIDGFTLPAQSNGMYVFDSSLVVKKQILLGTSVAGNYFKAPQRLKLFYTNLLYKNGQLFYRGQFIGINESPMNLIPVKDTALTVLPGLKLTVDANGPSRSFIARSDLSGLNGIAKWYGDHHEYESMFVQPLFFHSGGSNRIAYAHLLDNVWNPWLADDNLTVITGSMRKNADMPEVVQLVRFFNDGSRILMGQAAGKTALDSTGDFITNALRRDIFLVRLRPNNQVAWYKRFHSTLTRANASALEIKNGKAWFLVNYSSPQNDSNFVKIGTDVYEVKGAASLLANVDTAGNLVIINLSNPKLQYFSLTGFDFFSNGDIAAVSNTGYVPLANFPSASGSAPYIFRINSTNGSLIEIRRIYGSVGVDNIKIDKNDQLYLSGGITNSSSYKLYLHDGAKYIDTLSQTTSVTTQLGLLKMDWNNLKWQKGFSMAFLSRAELLLNNNKPVLFSPALANQTLSWEGQPVHNGFSSMALSIVLLDSNGSMTAKKVLPSFYYNYARVGNNGNLYLCGSIDQPIKVDTIQVNYLGNMDGLGLVLDSSLTALKNFRIASAYSESLLDMDILKDSIVAVAYLAQTSPQVYKNRVMASANDYKQDAYVGSFITRGSVVTAINNPLPLMHNLMVAPNPVIDYTLTIMADVSQSLISDCSVYRSNGQFVMSKTLRLMPGKNQYLVSLPPTLGKGVYYAIISNKKWTVTRSFIVQ